MMLTKQDNGQAVPFQTIIIIISGLFNNKNLIEV